MDLRAFSLAGAGFCTLISFTAAVIPIVTTALPANITRLIGLAPGPSNEILAIHRVSVMTL